MRRLLLVLLLAPLLCSAQNPVAIRVNAASRLGPFEPIYRFYGYDEPNFTYAEHGKKLLSELAALSAAPVYIRTHNLLTTGDGIPALKWGSTNAYTESASGAPIYDWTILDRIFDTYQQAKIRPLVEIGFMPEALSSHPEPYRHHWPDGVLWTGWAYPPRDYQKWAELVYHWVRHEVERYGRQNVESWYWEAWNEPNIGYWQGSPEEYQKLFDFTADAVKRALPTARIGGPHSTGPSSQQAADFLRRFLDHAVRGTNFATGRTGSPLDYIGFHAKGAPKVIDGRVQMGINKQLQDISSGFAIAASYPELRGRAIIIGESDPEGCAACSARLHPQNAYRNTALYACYTAEVFARTLELAARHGVNIRGAVTWAFEFENQPYFEGFRTLATNGIDKPVLNVFRMMGLLGGDRLRAESSGALSLEALLQSGARDRADINAFATADERKIAVLVWNYHDDDVAVPDAPIDLEVEGIDPAARRVLLRHYRVDRTHSNAYTVWQSMGSPQSPAAEQHARLERAGQLAQVASPQWLWPENGKIELRFPLPRQAVSLLELSW